MSRDTYRIGVYPVGRLSLMAFGITRPTPAGKKVVVLCCPPFLLKRKKKKPRRFFHNHGDRKREERKETRALGGGVRGVLHTSLPPLSQ